MHTVRTTTEKSENFGRINGPLRVSIKFLRKAIFIEEHTFDVALSHWSPLLELGQTKRGLTKSTHPPIHVSLPRIIFSILFQRVVILRDYFKKNT